MDALLEGIKNNSRIIGIVVILIVIIAVIKLLKKEIHKKQKKKELSQAAEDKIRDENLNQVILNQHTDGSRFKEVHKPYDVDYSNANGENSKKAENQIQSGESHVMVQLVEKTELSTRKFMMNPVKAVRVGSNLQDNDITVLADGVSPHQFEIFAVRDKVFVRNLSSEYKTIVRRKKEQAIVDEKGIRLLSGDSILLGHVTYDITIID